MDFDIEKIRKDFPILHTKNMGKELIYLDSAATSQKPNYVINAINEYYKEYNANIHRGLYDISVKATEGYTNSKDTVAKFIGASSYREIIYCKNATEALNLVALTWAEQNISQGDKILLTRMEHHSNVVPWQLLAKRKNALIDYINVENGELDMHDYDEKLNDGDAPKLVSFTHVSNVLGTINNAKELTKKAKEKGAIVVIDGAQSAPHMKLNVKNIGCDFFAFSSHKMLGPSGIGVLYGKEGLLEKTEPIIGGGDMIRSVDFDGSTWNELPWKFEAGTANIEGGIGLGKAVEYIEKIGIDKIRKHEVELTKYALEILAKVDGVVIYGPRTDENLNNKAGVISFNILGAHPHDVATIFNSEGVAIRAGHHCAMPLVNKVLNEPAVARMSFYLYNKKEEVDKAINAIEKVKKILKIKKHDKK
ncbi:MAG: cysteine desulfurase [Candidatus Micrarchaeaceae archaeon]